MSVPRGSGYRAVARTRSGGFATYGGRSRLRAIRRARQEDSGMNQVRDIADHGGKQHDPLNGPLTAWVHRLEGVGRAVWEMNS